MAKNLNKMLKQAQKMQSDMMRAQDELKKKTVEGTAGGGMVTVTMTGGQELVSVKIKPDAVDPDDVEMLEDLVMAAFNTAQEKVSELSNSAFGGISAGLQIPGM